MNQNFPNQRTGYPLPDPSELLKKLYLNEKEVSLITGKSIQTLRNDRHLWRGIPYLKIGKKTIRYLTTDMKEYMEARRITF